MCVCLYVSSVTIDLLNCMYNVHLYQFQDAKMKVANFARITFTEKAYIDVS